MAILSSTAIHECGHGVAACLYGIPLKNVTIISQNTRIRDAYGLMLSQEMLGHITYCQCFYENIINSNSWRKSNDYPELIHALVTIDCAGNVAELFEFGNTQGFVYTPDYQHCNYLLGVGLGENNPEPIIADAYERTKQILQNYKKTIRQLAEYLELKKTIDGNDFLRFTMGHLNRKTGDIQQMHLLRIHDWPKEEI